MRLSRERVREDKRVKSNEVAFFRIVLTRKWPPSQSSNFFLSLSFSHRTHINLHRAKQSHIWHSTSSAVTQHDVMLFLSLALSLSATLKSAQEVTTQLNFWLFRPWNSRETTQLACKQQQHRKESNTFSAKHGDLWADDLFFFASLAIDPWTSKWTLSRSPHDQRSGGRF